MDVITLRAFLAKVETYFKLEGVGPIDNRPSID